MRDDHKCVVCQRRDGDVVLQAHHWIVYDGACARTRYLQDNLVTLCASCHLFKLHQQADAETIDTMRNYMLGLIGFERYDEIKSMKHMPAVQRGLEDLLELEAEFKLFLDGPQQA